MLLERDHEVELSAVSVKPSWQRIMPTITEHDAVAQVRENRLMISRFSTVGDCIVSSDAVYFRFYHYPGLPTAIRVFFDNDEIGRKQDRLGLWLYSKGTDFVTVGNLQLRPDLERVLRSREAGLHTVSYQLDPCRFSHIVSRL